VELRLSSIVSAAYLLSAADAASLLSYHIASAQEPVHRNVLHTIMENRKEDEHVHMTTKVEDSPWYVRDIASILQPQTREMLQSYAGISPDDLVSHIEAARQRAWPLAPYPSVGALTWLNPYLLLHPAHDRVLSKVKSGAKIIDCACMVAPDLRYLASKGAPTKNMYGFDIEPGFFDIGFDFYGDRTRWAGDFFEADATKPFEQSKLGELKGQLDIIWCPKFLHLFDREHQIELAARLVELLRPVAGSMFVGSQNGLPESEELPFKNGSFGTTQKGIWMANADEIKAMWGEVAERTKTKWDVEARLLDLRTIGLHKDDGTFYKTKTGYNLQWTATLLEA